MATTTIYADQVAACVKLFNGDTSDSYTNYLNARNGNPADTIFATNIGQYIGQLNSAGGGLAGADAFAVYRSALIFSIPADLPSLVSAKLTMHCEVGTSFGSGPQYVYCLDAESEFADSGVVLADFSKFLNLTTEWGKIHSSDFVNNTDFDIILNALARTHIVNEKGSKAIFAFRSEHDINTTPPNSGAYDFLIFAGSSDVTPAQRPRLVLTYVAAPTVTTDPATGISAVSATLNGTLDEDDGETCECAFEWGLDTGYGVTTPIQSKTKGQSFSQVLHGLVPGTTYHFRAKATNSRGTSYGADESFSTKPAISKAYALAREEL